MFPFGHGLGYTSWTIGEATVSGRPGEGVTVSVPVHNTGQRAGSTVVQCYVEPVMHRDGRPLRTLQGFAKVRLAAGETGTAIIELPPRAFSRWDVGRHAWVLDDGDQRVLVGTSSRSLTSQVVVSPATGSA